MGATGGMGKDMEGADAGVARALSSLVAIRQHRPVATVDSTGCRLRPVSGLYRLTVFRRGARMVTLGLQQQPEVIVSAGWPAAIAWR